MCKLELIDNVEQIRQSLKIFKSQAQFHKDLIYEFFHPRQRNWVYDPHLDAFGTSKFVGYKQMTFELYRWAKSKDCKQGFHGSDTKRRIMEITEQQFSCNSSLIRELVLWGDSICPGITLALNEDGYKFISLL